VNALSGPSDQHRYGPAPALIALIQGAALAQAVCVAADLRIADLMAGGCTTADELAQAIGSHPPSLHRLLRALTSLGLCDEDQAGSFALTPMGSLLRSDTSDSLRSWLLWFGKYQWPVWGRLLHSVRTGESARMLVTGAEGFSLLQNDPEAAALFNDTMERLTRAVAAEVAYACDFAGMRRIVDVGGGYGTLLAAVLQAHPQLRGVLLDMPHAIEGAAQQFERSGLAERCEVIAGDFFQRIPEGADAYILKNIIHDWDDERSSAILDNCRRAIGGLLRIPRHCLCRSCHADRSGRSGTHQTRTPNPVRSRRVRFGTRHRYCAWVQHSRSSPLVSSVLQDRLGSIVLKKSDCRLGPIF
jgi:orsellinic acid C2-O-methyltransferase